MKYIIINIFILSYSFIFAQLDSIGCSGIVGDIKHSILQVDDFQALNGECWVLMDGRNISSTKLGALGFDNLPDPRGYFIRIYDNRQTDRIDVDRAFGDAIGEVQQDAFQEHTHAINDIGSRTNGSGEKWGLGHLYQGDRYNATSSTAGNGTETRPVNITMYLYIRIN